MNARYVPEGSKYPIVLCFPKTCILDNIAPKPKYTILGYMEPLG